MVYIVWFSSSETTRISITLHSSRQKIVLPGQARFKLLDNNACHSTFEKHPLCSPLNALLMIYFQCNPRCWFVWI